LFELFEWFNVRQHDNDYIDAARKKSRKLKKANENTKRCALQKQP